MQFIVVTTRELCKKAMCPLPASSSNQAWTASFSGRNLRWELVGNLFAIFGLTIMTVADWDPLFGCHQDGDQWNGNKSGEELRECAEACLSLCNDVDSFNDFVIALIVSGLQLAKLSRGSYQ